MTLCDYDKHGTAFQNSIIPESVPGTASDCRTVPGHNACLPGKAMHSTKQPAHQCHSRGLQAQINPPSNSSFQLQPSWVTQKSRDLQVSPVILPSLQTKVELPLEHRTNHTCVGLWIMKLPLILVLNTTPSIFSPSLLFMIQL